MDGNHGAEEVSGPGGGLSASGGGRPGRQRLRLPCALHPFQGDRRDQGPRFREI